jgi:hypothetical protein
MRRWSWRKKLSVKLIPVGALAASIERPQDGFQILDVAAIKAASEGS